MEDSGLEEAKRRRKDKKGKKSYRWILSHLIEISIRKKANYVLPYQLIFYILLLGSWP